MVQTDEIQADQIWLELVLQYLGMPPLEQEHFSVPSDSFSSTEFSSSSSPSSPGPLKMDHKAPGNPSTTPENELELPSGMVLLLPKWVICLIWPSVEELLGCHQEELLELE
ncbi:hypothetical protein O181_062321 [Austropuccinia psidii MF-1]|uniref:Uncharacterized protein n=1 Tax=Austropuccinia psidii MF-1 TaxID=1389203 RepID=A0A9Q3EPJ2_9BASI|nr:hypothetical protein [Austropuccinia psidii MF-1]